ncbi:MAG: bifunctional 23S rRNA (guanine(2069)-N(7))-methyltransferase RlmK/23S rRNA (guanine(2445)-N(2))-methyltransferase RlmL [Planctomycetia bacterium]|nr:bifunctional 23S rRNA (guanine(2069)-N(7))-methyltransferase RlmK/23S rRNA (guanine(2445)-N(2))-methyltransferase RlmL [Planctomycetia bacterium]
MTTGSFSNDKHPEQTIHFPAQVGVNSSHLPITGPLTLIATSTMGLESVVARELKQLGYAPKNSEDGTGRTFFSGSFRDIARANIWLRTAGKVLVQLAKFDVSNDFDALFHAAEAIDWENWMPLDAAILVEGRSVRSTITSVPALQRTVKKAIVNRLTKAFHVARLAEDGPAYTVEISLLKDRAMITLDTTGRGLHRRGYRLMNVAVPLRETLASALVQLSVWTPDRPLIDPFCASGTIPIEAAMLARHIAPGLKREFAAQAWPCMPSSHWQEVRDEATAAILPSLTMKITGSDIDAEALRLAEYHARLAGVADDITFVQRDFKDLTDSRPFGCVICNPPYGDRVGDHEQYRPLYDSMPAVLSKLPTWSHFIYTSWNDFEGRIGQQATRRRKLYNGRLECTYFQFLGPKPGRLPAPAPNADREQESPTAGQGTPAEVHASSDPTPTAPRLTPVFAGLDDYAKYQAEEFAKCLTNRAHHLRRYPKRGITCYRLYDRDFPEVPLAIDIFEGKYLHIAEYERPDQRTAPVHRLWLDLMVEKAGDVLGIEPGNIFLKSRARQRGESQYEKLSQSNRIVTVQEGGLKFLCNMTDYLDTGLFLDHRQTREMVRRAAAGKRFLNLFCYSGAFTCYAADGGANSSVSVDLSPNYLDWARANMEANGFDHRARGDHRYIKADVLRFLQTLPPAKRAVAATNPDPRSISPSGPKGPAIFYGIDRSEFDLCVCDPPTFSNSKSTESDWDVQRRHVELLRLLATRMKPGGVVFFSNNFRRFKLNEEALTDLYAIREISKQTVPDDFRNKRIHRCWRMTVRQEESPSTL